MKKFYNYAFHILYIYILVLSIFSIFNFDLIKTNYSEKVYNENEEKRLDSTLLVQNIEQEEEIESEIIEETPIEETTLSTYVETPNIIDVSSYESIASESVNISRYGPDCGGCYGGQTAAGYYVGDGRIYYDDPTYGSLRIVAADSKYPLGTVIRISHNGTSFGAIVLDRGGGIGDHAKFQIDLLEKSEKEANSGVILWNATLEVLRYGY